MHVEIQMRSGHSVWAKIRQNSDVIDIQGLLQQYWDSTEHNFTVPSQSRLPTRPPISDRDTESVVIGKYNGNLELRFFGNSDVRIFATAHPSQLMVFA